MLAAPLSSHVESATVLRIAGSVVLLQSALVDTIVSGEGAKDIAIAQTHAMNSPCLITQPTISVRQCVLEIRVSSASKIAGLVSLTACKGPSPLPVLLGTFRLCYSFQSIIFPLLECSTLQKIALLFSSFSFIVN